MEDRLNEMIDNAYALANGFSGTDITLKEDIETLLMHPLVYMRRTIPLYHGSIGLYKTIIPNSLNVGTNLSKPERASFWSDDKYVAIVFAIYSAVIDSDRYNTEILEKLKNGNNALAAKYNTSYEALSELDRTAALIYNKNGNTRLYAPVPFDTIKSFAKIMEDTGLYLYTKNIDPKTIGSGQAPEIREFTAHTEIVPDSVEKLKFPDIIKAITPTIPPGYSTTSRANIVRSIVGKRNWAAERRTYINKLDNAVSAIFEPLKTSSEIFNVGNSLDVLGLDVLCASQKIAATLVEDKDFFGKAIRKNMYQTICKYMKISKSKDGKNDKLYVVAFYPPNDNSGKTICIRYIVFNEINGNFLVDQFSYEYSG